MTGVLSRSRVVISMALALAGVLVLSPIAQAVGLVTTQTVSGTVTDASFFNSTTGIAITGAQSYVTSNSGKSWSQGGALPTAVKKISAAPNTTTAYATADDGLIYKTTNGGQTWAATQDTGTDDFVGIFFIDASTGWTGTVSGRIYNTTNGGTSWHLQDSPATAAIEEFYFSNNQTGFAVGLNGTVLKTIDGGTTWQSIGISQSGNLYDISFNGQTGIISGNNAVFKSTNGGSTWTALAVTGAGQQVWYGASVASNNVIALVSAGGALWVSNDSGTTWTSFNSPLGNELRDIEMLTVRQGVAVGGPPGFLIYDADVPPKMAAPTKSPAGATISTNQPLISWSAVVDDQTAIVDYQVSIDGGTYVSIGTNLNYTPPSLSNGQHSVVVRAKDAANNFSSPSDALTFTVAASTLSVSSITPTTVFTQSSVLLRAKPTSALAIASCTLYVNGAVQGLMTFDAAQQDYYRLYTFTSQGTYSAFTSCADVNGTTASGPVTQITASTVGPISPSAGTLVKLECPSDSGTNHICRAVYFIGNDGKRHAFPNAKIYASWYANFSDVQIVSAQTMASFALGKNIQYRPGVRMVKFLTDPRVYAIGKNGELRWITSQTIASELYGSNWNTKIDDLSDAFINDYFYGSNVTSSNQYSPALEMAGAVTPLYNY